MLQEIISSYESSIPMWSSQKNMKLAKEGFCLQAIDEVQGDLTELQISHL